MNIVQNCNVVSTSVLSTVNSKLKSYCGLILGTIPKFGGRNWWKLRRSSVRLDSVPTVTHGHFPITSPDVCQFFFSMVQQSLVGQASRSHSDKPRSVDSSGRVISPTQRPLPYNNYTRQTFMPRQDFFLFCLFLFVPWSILYLWILPSFFLSPYVPHCCPYTKNITQTSMPPEGFVPTIPANERPQTYALDRAATEFGVCHSTF
jgi:hypothetical protein